MLLSIAWFFPSIFHQNTENAIQDMKLHQGKALRMKRWNKDQDVKIYPKEALRMKRRNKDQDVKIYPKEALRMKRRNKDQDVKIYPKENKHNCMWMLVNNSKSLKINIQLESQQFPSISRTL